MATCSRSLHSSGGFSRTTTEYARKTFWWPRGSALYPFRLQIRGFRQLHSGKGSTYHYHLFGGKSCIYSKTNWVNRLLWIKKIMYSPEILTWTATKFSKFQLHKYLKPNCTSLLHIFDTWFFPLLRLERALVSSFQALKIDGSSDGLFNQVQYTLHEPALQPAMWSS